LLFVLLGVPETRALHASQLWDTAAVRDLGVDL